MGKVLDIGVTNQEDIENQEEQIEEIVAQRVELWSKAFEHLDEMAEPIDRLEGMLSVLMCIFDSDWDPPTNEDWGHMLITLHNLSREVKERNKGFWDAYCQYDDLGKKLPQEPTSSTLEESED